MINALADLTRALDAALLMQDLGLTPDPWQRRVLRSAAARMILLCCRQAGKSTVTAVLALHQALYRAGSLILLLSPSLRQSSELFRKVMGFYRDLDRPVPAEQETALTLALANRSRIVSLPSTESTIRRFSGVALLIVDEASRVPDSLYYAVRPMLATSRGRLVCLSTPFGRRGFFSDAWHSSEPWERIRVPAGQVPRIPAEFLAEERRNLGPRWYGQEYSLDFADAKGAVFTTEFIHAAVSPAVQPLSLG